MLGNDLIESEYPHADGHDGASGFLVLAGRFVLEIKRQ
jgi:hypothetical protein